MIGLDLFNAVIHRQIPKKLYRENFSVSLAECESSLSDPINRDLRFGSGDLDGDLR
jgi:hypothetical protein